MLEFTDGEVMDAFLSDIRYAIRNLIKRPGFTLIAVLTLGIGIGANSAMFSAIYALLMKPLAFPDVDRVVAIWDKNALNGRVQDRKSTRPNSSHSQISYAVFCLKKKTPPPCPSHGRSTA